MEPVWLSLPVAALLTTSAQPVLVRALRSADLLDVPNHRSSHAAPTPRGGGWGVLGAVAIVAGLGMATNATPRSTLVAVGCILAALVGGADDLRGLSARSRICWQLGIAALITAGTVNGPLSARSALLGLAVGLGVVAYVNAFNFMDGINGISAISGGLTAGWLGLVALAQDDLSLSWLAFAVMGSCAGFLPWNFPTARIFLGDVGSYFLGATLAALAIAVWQSGAPSVLCAAPFVPYLFDTGSTLLRRARQGASLTQAHRDHLYQRLARRRGHTNAASVVGIATVACLGAAVAADQDHWGVALSVAGATCGIFWALAVRPEVGA